MQYLRIAPLAVLSLILIGCDTVPPGQSCPTGTLKLPDCPPENAKLFYRLQFFQNFALTEEISTFDNERKLAYD